jgi:hypothetical protein
VATAVVLVLVVSQLLILRRLSAINENIARVVDVLWLERYDRKWKKPSE